MSSTGIARHSNTVPWIIFASRSFRRALRFEMTFRGVNTSSEGLVKKKRKTTTQREARTQRKYEQKVGVVSRRWYANGTRTGSKHSLYKGRSSVEASYWDAAGIIIARTVVYHLVPVTRATMPQFDATRPSSTTNR